MLAFHRVLSLAAAVMLAVGFYYVAVKGPARSAINRWRTQIPALWSGVDIYQAYAFPTPPIMAVVLTPFTLLPDKWPMATWFAFKAVLALATVAMLWRLASRAPPPLGSRAVDLGGLMFLALAAPSVLGDLLHGNVNIWVIFLVATALVLFVRGQVVWAGVVLGLAIACRVTPALFVVYFAWKREGRMLLATAFAALAWTFLVPGLLLGFERNLLLLWHWAEVMVFPYALHGQVDTEQINQSLPALWLRLMTPVLAIKPDDGSPIITVNLVTLAPEIARLGLRLLTPAVLLLLFCLTRRATPQAETTIWLHEFGLVLLASLLVSERSWKHHYTALLPTYAALVAAWAREWPDGRMAWRHPLACCLLAATAAMALVNRDLVRPVLGEYGSKYAEAYGCYVWAAVLLGLGHVWVLRRLRTVKAASSA